MKKQRLVSMILLMSVLSACGTAETDVQTSPENGGEDSAAVTEPSRENTPDSLPSDLDFGGDTFRIVFRDVEINIKEMAAEQTGDIVDDAVYNRNRSVEERLNCKFELIPIGADAAANATAVRNSIMAGADDYDLVAGVQWKALPQALENMYRNLNDNPYLDFDQPWWWKSYIEEISIGKDKTFFANGDLSLSSIQNMSCIFFNKEMFTDLGQSPDALYQTVLDGDWTYELLNEYCRMAYRDVNGNSERDAEDIYGFMARTGTETDHFTYTAGNVMSQRDKDGIPYLTVNTEYFIDYMQGLYDLYYNNEGVLVTTDEDVMRGRFSDGETLFLINRFVGCDYLREMKAEYGIIPFPKWSKTQESYGTLVHDAADIFAIPVTTARYDMAGAVLEALCAESYRRVVPAYFEMALKVKYVSDSTSGKIVDMIKSAAKTDFAYAYNYALNNAGLLCRTMINNKSTDFASAWASIEAGAQQGLKDIIALYNQLD